MDILTNPVLTHLPIAATCKSVDDGRLNYDDAVLHQHTF